MCVWCKVVVSSNLINSFLESVTIRCRGEGDLRVPLWPWMWAWELRGWAGLLSPPELGPGECHCAPEFSGREDGELWILPGLLLPTPPPPPGDGRTHTHTDTHTHRHTHTHTHLPLRGSSAPHFSGPGILQSVPDSLNYFYFSTESAEAAPVTMFYFDSGHLNWSEKAKEGQPAPLIFYEILVVL